MDRQTIAHYLHSDAVKYSIHEPKARFLYKSDEGLGLKFVHVSTVYFALQYHIFKILVIGYLPF